MVGTGATMRQERPEYRRLAACRHVATDAVPYRQVGGAARPSAESDTSSEVASIDTLLPVAVAAWLIGFGAAAAWLALQRRRSPWSWALLGAVIGPVALMILRAAPPGRCWSCSARTVGWTTVCEWCGEDVREPSEEPQPELPTPAPLTVIHGMSRNEAPGWQFDVARSDTAAYVATTPPGRPSVVATSGPVRRLKTTLDDTDAAPETTRSDPGPSLPAGGESDDIVLASAVYVTGSRGLQAGSRYGIALIGSNLGILGPVDVDPTAIAILRPLRGLDATGIRGQLIVTADERSRDRFALVFMALAGGTPERVAEIIAAEATAAANASAAR